ncbi:MAG TPA: alpha/beta hydrolase [Nitriliruptorales bacterium]|nr:alpha/beta hydrolase [Nitriliruptorales bacterium]
MGVQVPGGRRVRWRDVVLATGDGPTPEVRGRLWLPTGGPAPPVLLAAGVTPQGVADPRVMRLASALARAQRVVFVPELDLPRDRVGEVDVERLIRAMLALDGHPGARGGLVALGFSFGGSFSLVAAADERVADRLRFVAAFGAYGHLAGLVQAATTGVTTVGEHVFRWAGHERTSGLLRRRLEQTLASGHGMFTDEDRELLRALLDNRDPARVEALLARLPAPLPALMERLSPVTVAHRVRAPVALLHAVDDPIIPYAELHRLVRAFPDARVHEVRLFTHVDFRPAPARIVEAVRDLVATWRFAAALLAAGR